MNNTTTFTADTRFLLTKVAHRVPRPYKGGTEIRVTNLDAAREEINEVIKRYNLLLEVTSVDVQLRSVIVHPTITPLQIQLENVWMTNNYSKQLIDQVFYFMNNIDTEQKKKDWVKVPDLNFLKCVEHLTHDAWIEDIFKPSPFNIEFDRIGNLTREIESGVTFAFYERDEKLCWES